MAVEGAIQAASWRVRKKVPMEVVNQRCCGLDVHQASVCACVTIKVGRKSVKHKSRFSTNTEDLRTLVEWLQQYGVTVVAMEATGVYWKPVWKVLEGQFELLLVNPQHLKAIPGKKTDMKDGERICCNMGYCEGALFRQLRSESCAI